MKKIFLILLLTVVIGGCETARKTTNDKIKSQSFPKALAAVWEGYYSQIDWVIKFTPDGRIEYAKTPFGQQFVGPNSEAVFDAEDSNYTTVIKTGEFLADYNPDGTLSVSLEIINFDGMTPSGRIEMKGTEYLIGDVDLDKGIWNAVWFTEGGSYWITPLREDRVKLPDENDDGERGPLTLKRLVRRNEPNIPKNTN